MSCATLRSRAGKGIWARLRFVPDRAMGDGWSPTCSHLRTHDFTATTRPRHDVSLVAVPFYWLRVQSDAKRSRGRISLQFAICREIFRNCRESDPIAAKFSNGFKILEGRPPDQGAGKIFWYCREEQRGIANGGRVWRVWRAPGKRAERRAQIHRDYAWLGSRNQRIVTAAEERG